MIKIKEPSIKTRYFGSYLGIVFFACMIIGLILLSHAINQINQASWHDYQEKMALAADELQTQQDIFENISYRVKSSAIYRPFFSSRNPYYETEIVEDIAKYKDFSPLIDKYYCVQRETGSVYSTTGKLTIDQFEKYRLQTDAGIVDTVFEGEGFQIMNHPFDSEIVLFTLTFRVQADGKRGVPDSAMIFFVSKHTLYERLERISGLDSEQITIYWKDYLLLGDEKEVVDNPVYVESENHNYRVYSVMEPTEIYLRLRDFRYFFIVVLFSVTSILLLVAAFVAKRSYQPLDHLLDSLSIPQNGNAEDIEAAVKRLQDNNRYTMEQLQNRLIDIAKKRRDIAKQLLMVKISGSHNTQMDSLLSEAGISLNHPLYCVVLVHFLGEAKQAESVSAIARSLTDADISIYPAGIYQAQSEILLLNFEEHSQLNEICSVLLESLEANDQLAQLSIGDICEDIGRLPISFVSAITRREKEFENNSQPYADKDECWYDDVQIRLMMQALREGNSLKAQTCLNETVHVLETKYPSMLLQRCIWADIANQLLKTSKSINVQIEPKSLQVMMMSMDTHSFSQQMSVILDTITAAMTERSEQENSQMEKEIVNYIQENFYLPRFTITEVASQYNVTERKIGYIVKIVTGMTYKEYIIKLRIERAKMLLTQENYNVSQTSDSVGYNNIPYFIKTFRNYTGYTPGEYKKLFDKQNNGGSIQ